MVDDPVHGDRKRFQDFAFLDDRDLLEGVDEVGMDGKQADELVQPFVHVSVEPGERRQVVADLRLLVAVLPEEALGNDELDVRSRDQKLIETILHAAQAVRATWANRRLSKIASCTPATKRKRRSLQTSPTSRRKFRSSTSSWSLRLLR